jgi:hypothetical protein
VFTAVYVEGYCRSLPVNSGKILYDSRVVSATGIDTSKSRFVA